MLVMLHQQVVQLDLSDSSALHIALLCPAEVLMQKHWLKLANVSKTLM